MSDFSAEPETARMLYQTNEHFQILVQSQGYVLPCPTSDSFMYEKAPWRLNHTTGDRSLRATLLLNESIRTHLVLDRFHANSPPALISISTLCHFTFVISALPGTMSLQASTNPSLPASAEDVALLPESAWLQHRDVLHELYISENKTLNEVKKNHGGRTWISGDEVSRVFAIRAYCVHRLIKTGHASTKLHFEKS